MRREDKSTYPVVVVAADDSLVARSGVRASVTCKTLGLILIKNVTHHLPPFPSLLQQYGLPAEQAFVCVLVPQSLPLPLALALSRAQVRFNISTRR